MESSKSKKRIEHTTQYDDDCVPCKVLAFSKDPATNEVMVLVRGCLFCPTYWSAHNDTVLVEYWQLEYRVNTIERTVVRNACDADGVVHQTQATVKTKHSQPILCWVCLDSIVDSCFVVEEYPRIHEQLPLGPETLKKSWVMLVRKRHLWPDEFV